MNNKNSSSIIIVLAAALSTFPFGIRAGAATISADFESATPPNTPTGWTTVGTGGSGSYATTAGEGNPGQSGNLDWTGTNSTAPSVYLVNSGTAFDATQDISGSFDFYIEADGNYGYINFIMGDVQNGLTGSYSEFLNAYLRRRTFGARANLYAGDNSLLLDGSGDNTYQIEYDQWYSASFNWTASTGTFSLTWTGAQGSKGPLTTTGYSFDSNEVFFGFGTGDSPGRFDNISITGQIIPEPATLALLGFGFVSLVGTAHRRRRKSA